MPIPTPYLIQRGRIKNYDEPIQGIDHIVELDYMGSAEFEFGALPKSLKRMCRKADSLTITESALQAINGEKIHVIYTSPVDEVLVHIMAMAYNRYRLKEMPRIAEALNAPDTRRYSNFWWDIDNDYMFVLGKKHAEAVVQAIVAVRDKKKANSDEGWY